MEQEHIECGDARVIQGRTRHTRFEQEQARLGEQAKTPGREEHEGCEDREREAPQQRNRRSTGAPPSVHGDTHHDDECDEPGRRDRSHRGRQQQCGSRSAPEGSLLPGDAHERAHREGQDEGRDDRADSPGRHRAGDGGEQCIGGARPRAHPPARHDPTQGQVCTPPHERDTEQHDHADGYRGLAQQHRREGPHDHEIRSGRGGRSGPDVVPGIGVRAPQVCGTLR